MNNVINTDFKSQQTDSGGGNKQRKNSFNGLLHGLLPFSFLYYQDKRCYPTYTGLKRNTFYGLIIITKSTLEGNMLKLWAPGEIRGPPWNLKEFEYMFNSG